MYLMIFAVDVKSRVRLRLGRRGYNFVRTVHTAQHHINLYSVYCEFASSIYANISNIFRNSILIKNLYGSL